MPHRATLYHVVPLCAILCHFVPSHASFYHLVPLYAILCHCVPSSASSCLSSGCVLMRLSVAHNVSTSLGRLALALGYSKQSCFTYKVTFVDGGSELFHGQSLKNFVLQHVSGTGKVNFLFRAPKSGAYYVTIFAKLVTGEFGIKNTYTAACEYKVSNFFCWPKIFL